MVVVHSTMRQPPPDRDTIQLPTTTAFNICSGLFKMANCLVAELPEAQLRDIRYALDTLGAKVDRLLESGEYDLSLNFDDLTVDPDIPGSEDFGTVTASISTTANANGLTSLPSPRRPRHGTIRIPVPTATAPTPAPTPTPTPVPSASIPYHGQFPYVISSRENVGIPDYTHHPLFIRPGIPGAYQHAPTGSRVASRDQYHVVSKGLYVGIFTDWDEIAPWVTGISGSIYRKVRSWDEAKEIYNGRLATNAIQILR